MKNLIGVCDANEKDCQRARQWRLKFAKKRRRGCISAARRAGFHGGQFLWNDELVMCALPLSLPSSLPLSLFLFPPLFFIILLTMTAREIYRASRAI